MSEPGKPPDFSNLTENLSQQQAKISALKELVRQSESQHGKSTASAQEKVKNIAQRLSNLKSKTAKSKHQRSSSEVSEEYGISNIEEEEPQSLDSTLNTSAHSSSQRARSETPGSEKITLLRKQMELNRMKMAERESKSKEIEQMVTQLKSKFETSQMSLEKSVELGRSMGDLSVISSGPLHSQHRSVSDVSHTSRSFNLENERIKFLEKRIRELEATIHDKENLPESERVQRLEGKVLDLEENLREKESIIEARTKAVSLLSENLTKKKKDVVDSLEDTKQEMFKMQETFLETEVTYKDEVQRLNRVISAKSGEIENLNERCEILEKSRYDLTIENSELKTKLEDVQDYSTKISELNKLNETLQKQISNLENQRYEFITEDEAGQSEEVRETFDEMLERFKTQEERLEQLQENIQEKTVELNVVNANFSVLQEKYNSLAPKSLFPIDATDEKAQTEITKLKQQLDDSNKSMIKTKLKMKQLQKQVDSFMKSDSKQEVARLTEEVQTLTQRIADIEDDNKRNNQWQEWSAESETDLEKKIMVLETTCQNQTTAIQLLEEQKIDITEDLHNAKQELVTIKEQSELETRLNELEKLNDDLEHKMQQMIEERETIELKLARYVNENMELHEKIDKLSKGSSAESIEMVNLTAQENEEYQKALGAQKDDLGDDPQISQELNESLRNLREESSELMSKIELFTIERREVLDKLDTITIENQVLVSSIESIRAEKVALEHENDSLKEKKESIEKLLFELQTDKEELSKKVSELSEHRSKLQDEINKLVKEGLDMSPHSSPVKSADFESTIASTASTAAESTIDKEACEKLLKQLDTEIQNLNKNKDKHQKLKISKKLSDNAKNVHAMMTNLLVDYYKNLDDCKQLRTDLETVKVLLNTISSVEHSDEELQKVQLELKNTTEKFGNKSIEFDKLSAKLTNVQDSANLELDSVQSQLKQLLEETKKKDNLADKLQEMVDALTVERDRCEMEVQNQRTLVNDLREEFDQLCADVKVNNQRLNEKSAELDQLQREFDMRLKTSTNEVEILKTLVAEQKQLLIDSYQEHELDINQKIKEIENYQSQVKQMEEELTSLRIINKANQESFASDLNKEIAKLKELLDENNKLLDDHKDELLHKQETIDTLNNQIIDLYKTMEDNSNRIIEKEDELQYLQEINETNREEIQSLHRKLTESSKIIDNLRCQLTETSRQNEMLQQKSVTPMITPENESKHEHRIKQLEQDVKSLELKNKEQLDKLKKFAANLKKKQQHCTELEERLVGGSSGLSDVNELKAQIVQYEEQMHIFKMENSKLNNSLQKSSEVSSDEFDELRQIVNHKSQEIEKLKQQINESVIKCNQMEESLLDHQAHIQKLETEKVSLVESTNALNEISQELEKTKKERDDLGAKIAEFDLKDNAEEKKKMDKLKAAVVQLKHKLAEKKKEVQELTEELNKLKISLSETLQTQSEELKEMSAKILEETKDAYEHDIGVLKQQIADLEANNRLLNEDKQRKMSLEGQLENFEMINTQLLERIANMEESVASLESEKTLLHRERLSLAAELQEKDELIGVKLRDTESDNFQLVENIKELTTKNNALMQRLTNIEVQMSSSSVKSNQNISNLENENSQLQQQIQQLHVEIKRIQSMHESSLAAKHNEIDEMELDLSSQLQRIETEKKAVQEALEKASDQIIDFQDEVVRLKDNQHSLEQARADLERELSWLKLQNENYTQDQLENEQLRMQLIQSETETENLRSQNESLLENHNVEITILRQQIADLEAMRSQVSQNQTDDQVMLMNENVKLKELLVERESIIQQKSIQLQMVQSFDAPIHAINDPFSKLLLTAPSTVSASPQATEEGKVLEERLKQSESELEKVRESCVVANMELDMQASKLQEMHHEHRLLNERTVELQSIIDNLIQTNVELKASVGQKDLEIHEIRQEINSLRVNVNRSRDDSTMQVLELDLIEKNHTIENLQGILNKYESQAATATFSTSMHFGESAQSSAASLFDDYNLPTRAPQEVVEELIEPKKAFLCFEQQRSAETQTDDDWLRAMNENVQRIQQLEQHIQMMDQRFVEQMSELERQTQIADSYSQKIYELETMHQHEKAMSSSIAPFSDTPPATATKPQVVIEEIIKPKKAYLCYEQLCVVGTQTDDVWLIEQQENNNKLKLHIQIMEQRFLEQSAELERQAQSSNNYLQRIRELEITHTPPQFPAPSGIAQFFDPTPTSQLAALEIEDGWGWGAVETSETQQQVQQSMSFLSPRSDLEVRLQEQRDIVDRLEREKSSLSEELTSLRENSKKMMKKLKEYQTKIKELETKANRKSSSVESNDMDLVIQEELNSQIQKLEAKLKDVNAEKEKEQQEKDLLVKRVDVLTSANERMMEMKERQDGQMEMYQLKVRELKQKLHNLEEWGEDDEKKNPSATQMSPTKENEVELYKKIQELNHQVKDMQVDYDEIQALLDEERNNNKLLEERFTKSSSSQQQQETWKDEEIERLSCLLKEVSVKRESLHQQIHMKDQEIRELISKIDSLSNESSNIKTILDDLSMQIQLKTNENQELSKRLQKLETNNEDLSRERQLYSDSVEQNFRQHAHELEQQLQSLHAELQYKNSQIKQLNDKVCELSLESDQTQSLIKAVSAKDSEMMSLKSRLHELENNPGKYQQSTDISLTINDMEKMNNALIQEKLQMEHELQVLNDQVLASLEFEDKMKDTILELDAKNIEIQMLKASLDRVQQHNAEAEVKSSKTTSFSVELEKLRQEKNDLEQNMKSSIDLLNAQWSQVVEQRGNEIANSWKQHLEMREVEFADLEANFKGQLTQKSDDSFDDGQDVNVDVDNIAKMRSIMESQEVEIVSLKEQLAIRSAEYAALSAKVDPYHQLSTSMNVSPIPQNDSDKVPRSELDLALYMLHQRDMRLEEMTMELVRLLEERDQLQLRLSNSIRQMEDVKRKINVSNELESSDVSKTTTPEKSVPPAFEGDEHLRAKLSELHTVRHVRDKGIQDEREQRFMDNMTMLQRDVANIPPEAAARIVAGSSNQGSPSSVLMNWILGNKPQSQ